MVLTKWIVSPRQQCDLEMLLVGGFAPLTGFLSQADYAMVLSDARLTTGQVWPMPINLDVNDEFANKISLGDVIELCDPNNTLLARMTITDKWQPTKSIEAQQIFGTQSVDHPGVKSLMNNTGSWYLGGSVEQVNSIKHYDFAEFRHTPQYLKQLFAERGYKNIIGFQTRNPIHRAHLELTLRAAKQVGGHILLHPVVGLTKSGDIDYFTRVRCYQKIMPFYPEQQATLGLLPLAMRMAGPREALWHALIRKNYGCTHFIIGRDHAGPGNDSSGKAFYGPYAAQEYVLQFQAELGIKILTFQEMVYVKERNSYCGSDEVQPNETALTISGTQLRNALLAEEDVPEWFSFPEIIQELRQSYLPKHKQGYTLFFTGLSGAGKSTLAQALMQRLMCKGKRNVTLLDGDIMRRVLTSDLGFSKADRDLNIRRIGFVASEVTKVGGIALCAAIAPYADARVENRQLISQYGGYIEIYVSTSLATCEQRDTKGLYAKARNGELKNLTGVDDPYEAPINAELKLDTSINTVDECVQQIIDFLKAADYLRTPQCAQVLNLSEERSQPVAVELMS